MLGMYHQGLIWNNDLASWKKVRGCFQMSLNEVNMENAVKTIEENAILLIEAKNKTGSIDMMSICRQLTFRATLSTFFGINASEYASMVRPLSFLDLVVFIQGAQNLIPFVTGDQRARIHRFNCQLL